MNHVSQALESALQPFGVSFVQPAAEVNPYDSKGLWIGGEPKISSWGLGCGRGIQYADMGPITDGQKGAVRKISTGRKARGMASDGLAAVQGRLDTQAASD